MSLTVAARGEWRVSSAQALLTVAARGEWRVSSAQAPWWPITVSSRRGRRWRTRGSSYHRSPAPIPHTHTHTKKEVCVTGFGRGGETRHDGQNGRLLRRLSSVTLSKLQVEAAKTVLGRDLGSKGSFLGIDVTSAKVHKLKETPYSSTNVTIMQPPGA
ncbi:hypothetical protein chiPu_0001437 [Chiloscyllium punctatum]|uniref:Uncharacterized protein n=1 Tax=Chiloscyllium punctatum TaxID=137246 RepID=A0A401RY13_CHIPU|nr:hypothetical protein [Chiloscyllium punctatum]